MLTWTTYGTWLPGDKRGYVRDARILESNQALLEHCENLQKSQSVKLTRPEKEIVRQAILKEAQRINQKIEALAVCTNHIHLAARVCDKSIERILSMYKSAATRTLRAFGRSGTIWTTGFDKRFCFTEDEIAGRIKYIQNHNV